MKFVLSTGQVTTDIADYIIDLIKLSLSVEPGDIPGMPELGFGFEFAGIPKSGLPEKIDFRFKSVVDQIGKSFPNHQIEITELYLIDEKTVKAVITVDSRNSSDIYVDIYENR